MLVLVGFMAKYLPQWPLCAASQPSVNPRVAALRAGKTSDRILVSPSVAKANFWNLGKDLTEATEGGAEWLHFSVQDGRMVPKVSLGSPVISAVRDKLPNTVFDVKLGVIEPQDRIKEFVKAGADVISVHPEATLQLPAVINEIEKAGCAPGAILNPGTPISSIQHILESLDVIVVMLVNPGWGGPKYMQGAVDKIRDLRKMCAAKGLRPYIEVDGGVSKKNAGELIQAGANVLVAGGSVFTAEDKKAAIDELTSMPAGVGA